MRGGATRRLLEESRISLEEEYVVKKVETEWAKVEEGSEQSPILHGVSSHSVRLVREDMYLALEEDGPHAVEQLEGRDDVTLHQHACTQRRRHPPASAHGHLIEPLLERKAANPSHHAIPALKYVCHVDALHVCAVTDFS